MKLLATALEPHCQSFDQGEQNWQYWNECRLGYTSGCVVLLSYVWRPVFSVDSDPVFSRIIRVSPNNKYLRVCTFAGSTCLRRLFLSRRLFFFPLSRNDFFQMISFFFRDSPRKKAIPPYSVHPFWRDVLKKSSQKVFGGHLNCFRGRGSLVWLWLRGVTTTCDLDNGTIKRAKPSVRNRCPVGVARKISDDHLRASIWRFTVDNPAVRDSRKIVQ